MLSRRELLKRGAVIGAASIVRPCAAFAAAGPADRNFTVLRDGNQIGHHTITFSRNGDDFIVDVGVELKVTLAFVTLYSLTHRNRETWRAGELKAIDTNTLENGKIYTIKGESVYGGFRAAIRSGDKTIERMLPRTIVPTSYWNPATVEQTTLLNTANGENLNVKIIPRVDEPVKLRTSTIQARKFSITGGLNLDLWYDTANEVVRLAFENRDSTIEYELRA
ncbi:MAG: hypothetical protein EXQ91_04520 [Alphaproteobacteria bacterium]|nr:hypothetical protein [Alphaproteobacteria bacterium]